MPNFGSSKYESKNDLGQLIGQTKLEQPDETFFGR